MPDTNPVAEAEPILDPEMPIIDPHHHLWDLRPQFRHLPDPPHAFLQTLALTPYYAFDQLLADTTSGHRILATVYVECGAFYRAGSERAMAVVGEVEFVNGVAAQGASGLYGAYRPCAAIVGHADLTLGDGAKPVLEALAAASPRFCGIRQQGAWDADISVLGRPFSIAEGLYGTDSFRAGFRHLDDLGLTFDAYVLEPQLDDVIDLARAFPDQPIVLDHCGTPLGIGIYKGTLSERFDRWRRAIRTLGELPNVAIKLGGLAMPFCGLPEAGPAAGLSSAALAALWQPYIETCIEAFGPDRAMFESNYPVDKWGASYATLWNAFKRLAAGASASEKRALFAGTAARVYGIEHLLPAA